MLLFCWYDIIMSYIAVKSQIILSIKKKKTTDRRFGLYETSVLQGGNLDVEKKEEIWLNPMTKSPMPIESNLERSDGVTSAFKLMRFNRLTGFQPSNLPQKLCNHKDAHLTKLWMIVLIENEGQQQTRAERSSKWST